MVISSGKKFGWVIKDFSLQSDKCYSAPVMTNDCKWRLLAYPKGNNCDYFSLYLDIADFESLPCGWRKYVKIQLTIVNQLSHKLSITKETEHCFHAKSTSCGFLEMLPISQLHEKDGGFLVNGEIMILAEIDVFEIMGSSEASPAISQEVASNLSNVMEELTITEPSRRASTRTKIPNRKYLQ